MNVLGTKIYIKHYINSGDISNSRYDMETIHKHAPASSKLAYQLQYFFNNPYTRDEGLKLRHFALDVIKDSKTNNPAMWQYSIVFIAYKDGYIDIDKT